MSNFKKIKGEKSTHLSKAEKKFEEDPIEPTKTHDKSKLSKGLIPEDVYVSDDSGLGNIFGAKTSGKKNQKQKLVEIKQTKEIAPKTKIVPAIVSKKKVKEEDSEEDFYEEGDEGTEEDEESEIEDPKQLSDEDEDLEKLGNMPSTFKLKTGEDGEEVEEDEPFQDTIVETHRLNMDMAEISLKIKEIVEILADIKNKNKNTAEKSRSDLMQELKDLCKVYYDYNEDIMTLVMNLFAPNEAVEFLEASAGQRVMSIRTNTLKTKRRELAKILINRGVNLDPLAEWTKVGLKIFDSTVPVGATPEYLAGHYMLQSGSSFIPVVALQPKENEKILDMCAAPGGKTTYIAQLMKNTGVLVANDIRADRLKSLYFNLHRLGVKNTVITNYDGRKLITNFSAFDRVLLDAPCSGLGVISKDPTVKVNRVSRNIYIYILQLYLF